MKTLFTIILFISGTCFAATDTKALLDSAAQCAAMKNVKGSKIVCPPTAKQNYDIEVLSEMEMAEIEDEMGPPPAALPEGEDLVLE